MGNAGRLRSGRRVGCPPARGVLVAGVAVALLTVIIAWRTGEVDAQATPPRLLTAAEVVAALQRAGLAVDAPRPQPGGPRGPSGPPATEREAVGFSVPDLAPSGGRILVFADADALRKKAAWFERAGAGATVLAHRNVILWLDPAMAPHEAARYRQALQALR